MILTLKIYHKWLLKICFSNKIENFDLLASSLGLKESKANIELEK